LRGSNGRPVEDETGRFDRLLNLAGERGVVGESDVQVRRIFDAGTRPDERLAAKADFLELGDDVLNEAAAGVVGLLVDVQRLDRLEPSFGQGLSLQIGARNAEGRQSVKPHRPTVGLAFDEE
jgi:hypothetical protein